MATEGVSSRITRLNQLLIGKTLGKKVPLLDKETLLDAFMALYHECSTEHMTKDKNIATYVRKFKPLICELEKLRLKKSDFEIRKTIGRGHFGEVHVVHEKVSGNVYAMKVLKKSETLSQDNVAFFEEERDIMAFAQNPWITSLQYAFQDFESLYLVMDFHPGGDLLSLLAKYDDIFEEDIAKFYLAEMIIAIHAVHALGYVHRDIKPENVLIDRVGHIKLADFGSSARLSSAKMVVSKMPVGTPEYIAPEVLMSMDGSGSGGKYGIECDWWSLGVVAYEMMVGNTPFQADSVVVVYSQIMNFKNSLQFPDDEPLTDNAKGLIRGLLTDQKNRIGYTDLAKHPFFTGLDWTTLQDAVPPYVPTIAREDDTSNFDDFETESSGPRIDDFMEKKKGFLGKDLPFIGFTFTKQLTLASLNETISDPATPVGHLPKTPSIKGRDSVNNNTGNNTQVLMMKKDMEKEQKKNKELLQKLDDKGKSMLKLEGERDGLENEKALLENEKKDLQRNVSQEKEQREKLEKEINSLRKEVQEGNKKMEELKNRHIESSNDEVHQLKQDKKLLSDKVHQLESDNGNYQKQIDDSKNRVTDLQTKLAKVNEETKTNVTELQQKLQKVTTDNENRIKQFQEKLVKALQSSQETADQLLKVEREKEDLEKEVSDLKNFEDQFKQLESEKEANTFDSNEKVQKLEKDILTKNKECEKLQNEVKNLQNDLQDSRTKYDKLVEFGEDLKEQVERKIERLQRDLANSRKEHKKVDTEYKKLKEDFDDKNNNLNTKDSTITTLQTTCTSLEKQLNDLMNTKEMNAKELDVKVNQERMQLSRKMSTIDSERMKTGNEISKLKNELKETQEAMKKEKENLNEAKKQIEENTDNYELSLQKVNKELSRANEESKKYQRELASMKETSEQLKREITELQAELNQAKVNVKNDDSSKMKSLEEKLRKNNVLLDNLKADKKVMESKFQQYGEDLANERKLKEQIQEELNEKERQMNSQDLTIQMLKQTATMLEGQVEELEVMNDEYQDRETQWNMVKRQQYQAQEKLEQQVTEALGSAEHLRQMKNNAEEKLRQMEEDNGSSKVDLENKMKELEQSNASKEERLQELTSILSAAERKNGLNAVSIKNLERKLETETAEKEKYAAEVSQLEDLSAQQTSSNFTLTVEIEALKDQEDELLTEKENLQNQLERNAFSFAEEKIKLESTLAQQTKLIDFLQKKAGLDDPNFHGKKGKFAFGRTKPESNTSPTQQADARKTRDLEKALEKEKNANLQLHLQLQKAREELSTLRADLSQARASIRSPSNPATPRLSHKVAGKTSSSSSVFVRSSPSTSVADIYQMAENEVRGSVSSFSIGEKASPKAAHQLQQTLNMRPSKCPVCLNSVQFGKEVSKCTKCHIVCHSSCAPALQNLCGVPNSLLGQFSMGMNRASLILDDGSVAIDVTSAMKVPKVEGWLKFPRKTSSKQNWEKKWVLLHDMKLSIYDNENTIEFDPYDEIDLNINEGELNIHPAIPNSELIWAAGTDLPLVFSIELLPDSLGWPRRTLYFLAPTFSDKQKWVAGLELAAEEFKRSTQKQGHGMADNVILTVEGAKHIDAGCAVMINETGSVLGCEDGLYVVSFKPGNLSNIPIPIVGLGPVYQLTLVKELDLALVIAGKDRLFCYINMKDLENRLKQLQAGSSISAISSQQIDKVKACHLFTVGKVDNDYYACAATSHKLNILKFNQNMQTFVLKKELETNTPCTCLLLTSNSVIYGTNKFYTVDLKNYHKRDFLDASDTSLAFAVFGTTQTHSYPIAIFTVNKGMKREEFLLCYNEFGVFVDWQGRRSRKGDLKWSRLPLAFEYHYPFLYITHFASIEICEISSDPKFDISSTNRRFIDVPDPRFLGSGLDSESVLVASTQKNKLEIIQYQEKVINNGVTRHASTLSGLGITSGASVANAILQNSNILSDPIIQPSQSTHSMDSDEETSNIIAKESTPRSKRKEQLRSQEKDRNRISFRFFGRGNRKSQYDGN